MKKLQIFNSEEFGEIRTVTIDNEPWFVGKDVAEALGYSNTRDALATHVSEEDKNTVVISDGKRGNPNQVVINESGLYALIFGSKLDSAKRYHIKMEVTKIKNFIYELFFKKRYSVIDIVSICAGIIIGHYIFSRYISPMM